MAVLLSQAAAYRFTGIGLSIGATSCSYSLARQGIELASGCVPVGADHIDERLAEHDASFIWDRDGTRYLDTAATLKWKHAFDGRIDDPGSVHENILRDSYQELLEAVFTHMQRSIERCTDIASITGTVLPFICCGGPTQINGFAELTGELLSSAGLPIEVGPVSIAGDAVFTVARGCLIHANLDDDAARRIGRMAA